MKTKFLIIAVLVLGCLGCTKKTTKVVYVNPVDTTNVCPQDSSKQCHDHEDKCDD